MRRLFKAIRLILVWLAFVIVFFVGEAWLYQPPVERGNITSLENYLTQKLKSAEKSKRMGSAALILSQHGKVVAVHGFGVGTPQIGLRTDPHTSLFLLCSVSKAVTAWGILKLVQDGKLDLDKPVMQYLKRWQFPGNDPFRHRVTIRHLLSHTAGIDDGFGTSGYLSAKEMPPLEVWLSMPSDANMGSAHPTLVQREPGTALSYSTAGYGVLQLVVEEVTGLPFYRFMKESVLLPLGMRDSGYDLDEMLSEGRLPDIVGNYDQHLKIHPLRRYSNQAGVSLRVTAHDMAQLIASYGSQNPVLTPETLKNMLLPQPGTSYHWSLGHQIYISHTNGSNIVGHGGGAFPRTGASMRINPASGNGIAILMAGGTEMIDPYMQDWIYWETGETTFDIRSVFQKRLNIALILVFSGTLLIVFYTLKQPRSVPGRHIRF